MTVSARSKKPSGPRSLCTSLLMVFALFTGWTSVIFTGSFTVLEGTGFLLLFSLVDDHRVFGELLLDPLFERLLLLDAQVAAAALPR